MPIGRAGIWHEVSRCVRRNRLLEPAGRREWIAQRFAAWFGVLSLDLLGYAIMGNHLHVVIRTRLDRSRTWPAREVVRRMLAAGSIHDGSPSWPEDRVVDRMLESPERVHEARLQLSYPGMMLHCPQQAPCLGPATLVLVTLPAE